VTDTPKILKTETAGELNTTCPYCGVGCGVSVRKNNDRIIAVSGDESHPANYGRLCVKGSSLHETTSEKKRLLKPVMHGEEVSWEKAVSAIANGFSSFVNQYGADSVSMYVSGQLLTEDYYVANKLMKGFIGTANIDTNSRLCMSSAVAGYKRSLGEDLVPCDYTDLEETDLLVLVGSNAAWAHPILYQRMEAAKKQNPNLKVIVIDPRKTATSALADLHLMLEPGSDAALFMGLTRYLIKDERVDSQFVENSVDGYDALSAAAEKWTIPEVSKFCGTSENELLEFFGLYANRDKVVTFYSQGVNQSSSGVDKSSAIINCHLITGRIGKPGAGPFSITGQPNAMGGREVGGLANQLAAHMDIENHVHRERVQRFWNSPTIAAQAGFKALDLFENIHTGKVKAVWIMATNPLVSLPNYEFVKEALAKCELVIVSDMTGETDTADFADILLPATSWGEKDGTVTNSERRISRQKGLVSGPGESKHDWQAICDVAKAMGFEDAFSYSSPGDIFREHAALSGFENERERFFDISALEEINDDEYNALMPIQWPLRKGQNGIKERVLADGVFPTPSGKAKLIAVEPKLPTQALSEVRPLRVNSGRIRDQWHTMTRTGLASRLHNHLDEPYVEMHPKDLNEIKAESGQLIKLESEFGRVILRARATENQRKGEVFVPIHWNRGFASSANVGALFDWVGDPISGQPESKHGAVSAEPVTPEWQGTFCSTEELSRDWLDAHCEYWSKAFIPGGFRYQVAGSGVVGNWYAHWLSLHSEGETLAKDDPNGESVYLAQFVGSVLQSAAIIGKNNSPRLMIMFSDLVASGGLEKKTWSELISSKAHEKYEKQGAQVCSCFKVNEAEIKAAIKDGINTVEGLGDLLKCGTKCGSCIPELSNFVQANEVEKDKEEEGDLFAVAQASY